MEVTAALVLGMLVFTISEIIAARSLRAEDRRYELEQQVRERLRYKECLQHIAVLERELLKGE